MRFALAAMKAIGGGLSMKELEELKKKLDEAKKQKKVSVFDYYFFLFWV